MILKAMDTSDMRDATREEQKSITEYILSISSKTGITFDDFTVGVKHTFTNIKNT